MFCFLACKLYLCRVMHKILTIIIAICCSFIIGYEDRVSITKGATTSTEELSNRFLQQLECSHRSNDSAERTHSITVPASQSSASVVKQNIQRSHILAGSCASVNSHSLYCVDYNNLYRLSGSRAVDYYLYALCCLRC